MNNKPLGLIALGALLAGCTIGTPAPSLRATQAARWEMPAEFRPTAAPGARREAFVAAYVPKIGYVRGTPDHVRTLNDPLPQRPGVSNRALKVCRGLIETAAKSYGATRIEAASAGPQKRLSGGGLEAPLRFRIIYPSNQGFEVRQATIGCQLDASYTPVATPILST